MKKYKSLLLMTVFAAAFCPISARSIETKAKNAALMDYETGTVFYEKNADERMAPASMSKLMTAYMIFERLKNGALSLDDEFVVSVNAWRKGGAKTGSSTMFLNSGSSVKLSDLLRGIIVQSGNDACITAAENIAGSEQDFAELANQKARELGLTNTHMANATGWPNPEHYMSPRDLATLAARIIREFPEYYGIYSEKEFTYNGIKQGNRNPLLFSMPDIADGMKTGHTSASGYGLVGSAKKNGRRIIMVINGLKTQRERSEEAKKLMLWGFRDFDNYSILKKDVAVVNVPVWLGGAKKVSAVPAENIVLTLPKGRQKNVKARVVYESPVSAPVKKGQKIAELTLEIPERDDMKIDLFAKSDVRRLGYFGRLKELIKYFLFQSFSRG